VRFLEHCVVGLAQQLARSIEQAVELGIELRVHAWTLTRRSRPG
jgi:hypothetical protein